jgi:hypothetical protein
VISAEKEIVSIAGTEIKLRSLHDQMGHQGRDRTTSLIRDRFFWHGLTRDVEDWISSCDRCLKRKTPRRDQAPLVRCSGVLGTLDLRGFCPDITCEIQKRRTPSLFWTSAKSTLLEMKGSELL